MTTLLIAAAAISALAAIAADFHERKPPIFYLLKPLTTVLIAALAVQAPDSGYRNEVLIALGLSLIGDICLMFDGDAFFMGGLGSFLLAHFAFVAAFMQGDVGLHPPAWIAVFLLIGIGFFIWLLPKAGKLKLPVLLYGCVLMAMAVTASARWQALPGPGTFAAMLGALIFMASDSALAVRKFHGAYYGAQALILSTYWLAIGLIAWSALAV